MTQLNGTTIAWKIMRNTRLNFARTQIELHRDPMDIVKATLLNYPMTPFNYTRTPWKY